MGARPRAVVAMLAKVRGVPGRALVPVCSQAHGEVDRATGRLRSRSAVGRARAAYLLGLLQDPQARPGAAAAAVRPLAEVRAGGRALAGAHRRPPAAERGPRRGAVARRPHRGCRRGSGRGADRHGDGRGAGRCARRWPRPTRPCAASPRTVAGAASLHLAAARAAGPAGARPVAGGPRPARRSRWAASAAAGRGAARPPDRPDAAGRPSSHLRGALGELGDAAAVPPLTALLTTPDHRAGRARRRGAGAHRAAGARRLVTAARGIGPRACRGPRRPGHGPSARRAADRAGTMTDLWPAVLDALRASVAAVMAVTERPGPRSTSWSSTPPTWCSSGSRPGTSSTTAAGPSTRATRDGGEPARARGVGHRPRVQRGGRHRHLGEGHAVAALPPARGRGRRRRQHRRHLRAPARRRSTWSRSPRELPQRRPDRVRAVIEVLRARATAAPGWSWCARRTPGAPRRSTSGINAADRAPGGHGRRRLDPRPRRAARRHPAVRRRPHPHGRHRRGDPRRSTAAASSSGRIVQVAHARPLARPDPGRGVPARLPARPHRLVAVRGAHPHQRRLRPVPSRRRGRGRRPGPRQHRRGLRAGHAHPPPPARRAPRLPRRVRPRAGLVDRGARHRAGAAQPAPPLAPRAVGDAVEVPRDAAATRATAGSAWSALPYYWVFELFAPLLELSGIVHRRRSASRSASSTSPYALRLPRRRLRLRRSS